MQKTKKIMIVFIIMLSILAISLYCLIKLSVKEEEQKEIENERMENITGDFVEDLSEFQDVAVISYMKTVEQCIQNYFDTVNINSDKYFDRTNKRIINDEQLNNNIISLLNEDYIEEKKITANDLDKYINKIDKKLFAVTLDMKYIKEGNIYKYKSYGILTDSNYKIVDKYYIYVDLDVRNKTYSVKPTTVENYNNEKVKINEESIENKEINTYTDSVLGFEETIREYVNRYKRLTLADSNLTYNFLDDDYKNKRFKNEEDYKQYVIDNSNRISQINITKYSINYKEDCIEFVCIDQNDFYYIIRQSRENCLNFKLMLDTYTIETEDFITKYEKSSSKYKVGANIDKVISAINSKDYDYIYSKLDEKFKSNNCKKVEDLKSLLQNNLYEINKVVYTHFTENGNDIYTYKVKASSIQTENQQSKEMTFIVKLLDNRDFKMSFSF